ncbi:MAG TPA: ABC transporter permease, partial [Cerasibacillus sp.]
MIRFIWQNWWRRKERFFLILVGVLIISVGLTYLVGLSEMNRGTIVDELQKRWKSSYDIVVRPKGTRSLTEETGLLDPNYLSGISGGITMEQYETIKNIPNVDVAAPIAPIGKLTYIFNVAPYEYNGNGIYRLHEQLVIDDNIQKEVSSHTSYDVYGDWDNFEEILANKPIDYPIGSERIGKYITNYQMFLLAAIDPEQEAKLIGLDKAIVDVGSSRYFDKDDKVFVEDLDGTDLIDMPIIMSNQSHSNHKLIVTFEKLDIPTEPGTAKETFDEIMKKGGQAYLDTLPSTYKKTYSYSHEEIMKRIGNGISRIDMDTGETVRNSSLYLENPSGNIEIEPTRPSPLQYTDVDSPFPEKWPFAFQLKTFMHRDVGLSRERFRQIRYYDFAYEDTWPVTHQRWIGFYDSSKLNISKDPTNELPMETYRPASSKLVLDKDLKPINPPITLKPTSSGGHDALDIITEPPTFLTTLEAAEAIIGDKPISAIRIRVKDVTDLSEDSQAKIEKVADEIER